MTAATYSPLQTKLYNNCMDAGIFPQIFKTGKITPNSYRIMCRKLSCEVPSVRTIIIYLMFIQMVKFKFSCFLKFFLFSCSLVLL